MVYKTSENRKLNVLVCPINSKIFKLLLCKIKNSSFSNLRTWNHQIFGIFAQENDLNNSAVPKEYSWVGRNVSKFCRYLVINQKKELDLNWNEDLMMVLDEKSGDHQIYNNVGNIHFSTNCYIETFPTFKTTEITV